MKTHRFWRLFSATLFCVFFTSCEDVSQNPLSDPEKSKADPRLEGKWLLEDDPHAVPGPVVFASGKLPKCMMEAPDFASESKEPESKKPESKKPEPKDNKKTAAKEHEEKKRMLLFPTQIGDRHFLNVCEVKEKDFQQMKEQGWKPELVKGYYLYLYKIEKDELVLQQVAKDVKKKAIENGKIKGVTSKHDSSGGSFTDTTENLNKFYSTLDDKQFEDFIAWKKVK